MVDQVRAPLTRVDLDASQRGHRRDTTAKLAAHVPGRVLCADKAVRVASTQSHPDGPRPGAKP